MRLSRLLLEQFRSYDVLDVGFPLQESDVHVFVGANAAGKTNVLEAIGLLSLTKSCQGNEDEELIRWGSQHYRVTGEILSGSNESSRLEVACQLAPRRKKACFRNDVPVAVGEMVGTLPVVFFLPQDLGLFSGPPQRRRQFLDQLLCQVSPQYIAALSQYTKVLKQRNSLLKDIAQRRSAEDSVEIWDGQLAIAGAEVTLKRLELMEVLQCTIAEEIGALGESWKDVQLVYERKGEARTPTELTAELVQLLTKYRERDILLQATTVGPHRDDWQFLADGRSLPSFASRGQQRAAVLALVLLQVSYLELRRGEHPVLLLDDVFSELDSPHQEALLQSVTEHQVFITTTQVPPRLHGAQVWDVEQGMLQRAPVARSR
jgi:DNA replication and repair protein RecF